MKAEDACKALSGRQVGGDTDAYLPLVTVVMQNNGGAVVQYLGPDPFSVPAEPLVRPDASSGIEAHALPARVMIQIAVPSGNWDKE
mmetsp:Transcript_68712/g.223728  ORF Transcript_68712/g.223728 Transcript_68712/m.223728 type:complete len:86 (-) Transcript_68712:81-338(-)